MILFLFLIFSLVCSRLINQYSHVPEQEFKTLLNKDLDFQKEEEQPVKRNLASTTNKFHILSVTPSEIHIDGGDEVEIQIDNPKSKEVYCKIGLEVTRGLNKDNKTMVCLLPQIGRQIFEGKNTVSISLSFDKIHWCEPYSLTIIQEDNSFPILGFLSFVFGIVLIASIKLLCFDTIQNKNKYRRRKPPKKMPESFNKEKRSEVNDDDPFVFNRKILGSSFL